MNHQPIAYVFLSPRHDGQRRHGEQQGDVHVLWKDPRLLHPIQKQVFEDTPDTDKGSDYLGIRNPSLYSGLKMEGIIVATSAL